VGAALITASFKTLKRFQSKEYWRIKALLTPGKMLYRDMGRKFLSEKDC
tara:strand:- start:49 stop:195 length:147 start_codon:yes stop_codon:yes gene_type:complete